jgi:dTDP-4-amino-4,6-dideoxygalactose transaminase
MKVINVTKPVKPHIIKLLFYWGKILRSNWFTNDGEFVRKFENRLRIHAGVEHCVVMSNGTLPLVALLSTIKRGGNILTTPFTFSATSHAIYAAGHRPIYVDINAENLQVDLELLIDTLGSNDISGVLLTHVYGRAEGIEAIIEVVKPLNIPIFFDAAHAVGVRHGAKSLFDYGNASTLSMHATKILSSVEGGCIFTNDEKLASDMREWRNFGMNNGQVVSRGTNAKMSEFHAAFGLASFDRLDRELKRRAVIKETYSTELQKCSDIKFINSPNNSYFPILVSNETKLLAIQKILNENGIFPRRYFYPSLNILPIHDFNSEMSVAESVSSRVLCLPGGVDVNKKTARRISKLIRSAL